MTPIIHNYSRMSRRTVSWDTSDSQAWYEKNMSQPATRDLLEQLGYIKNPVKYQFNSHGFRTAEFDQQFDIVCFGCSFTMGTGLHAEETWPEQLQALTGLRVANLGHAGSSNDTAFRFARHYLPLLRPKYAIWLQTDMHRIELLDDVIPLSLNILATDRQNPCADDYFVKTWFTNSSNQELNLEKNTRAFEHLCSSLNITGVVMPRSSVPPHPPYPGGGARDLTHPGRTYHEQLAQQAAELVGVKI